MPTAFVREVLLPRDPQQQPALAPDACRYVLQVRRSPVHGWGLFTTERIPARRRVIEYGGQRISASEAAISFSSAAGSGLSCVQSKPPHTATSASSVTTSFLKM